MAFFRDRDTTVLLLTERPFEVTPMAEILNVLDTQQGVKLPYLRWNDLVELFPGYGFTEESHAIFDNVTAKEFLASNAINALWVSDLDFFVFYHSWTLIVLNHL